MVNRKQALLVPFEASLVPNDALLVAKRRPTDDHRSGTGPRYILCQLHPRQGADQPAFDGYSFGRAAADVVPLAFNRGINLAGDGVAFHLFSSPGQTNVLRASTRFSVAGERPSRFGNGAGWLPSPWALPFRSRNLEGAPRRETARSHRRRKMILAVVGLPQRVSHGLGVALFSRLPTSRLYRAASRSLGLPIPCKSRTQSGNWGADNICGPGSTGLPSGWRSSRAG